MKCNVFEQKIVKNKNVKSYDAKISLITVLRAGGLSSSSISLVFTDLMRNFYTFIVHICNRGSNASLNPSPININPIAVIATKNPGQRNAGQKTEEKAPYCPLPYRISVPQNGIDSSPNPMKAILTITKIPLCIAPNNLTMIRGIAFGKI